MMKGPEPSKANPPPSPAALWRLYGFKAPSDLVVEDLALALGVLILEGPLDSADARLIRRGARGLIRVKQDIPESGRKRFAIAHELGHWLLHRNLSQVLACTSEDMVAKYKASAPEIEANCFAAELLMPEMLFLPRIRVAEPSFKVIKELAAYFQTSLTATAIRYVELSDDYCAVVVSENGMIRWWRGSKSFEDRCWVDAGSPLSRDTVAGAFFAGEQIESSPQELDVETWLSKSPSSDDLKIIEEAIMLKRYGQVISLIRLI